MPDIMSLSFELINRYNAVLVHTVDNIAQGLEASDKEHLAHGLGTRTPVWRAQSRRCYCSKHLIEKIPISKICAGIESFYYLQEQLALERGFGVCCATPGQVTTMEILSQIL
jgi:hypothetical protein